MNKSHSYCELFTLFVTSDLPLITREIEPSMDMDVNIHRCNGETSLGLQNNLSLLLDIPTVAQFHIQQGNQIAYAPYDNVTRDDLRLYLLGSCMGALLQQRGFIVLHGNAITYDNETCTIFVGDQGAGKSTTTAWHYLQGASIVADDICAIAFNEQGYPVVLPSYPQLKLWQKSADLLQISTNKLKRVRQQNDKFIFPVTDRFAKKPCVVKEIVELDAGAASKRCLSGVEKVLRLQHHSYRYYFLSRMNLDIKYLEQLMRLANQIKLTQQLRMIIHA